MGRDLRRAKYRIDRPTDQSGANFEGIPDYNYTALYLKEVSMKMKKS